MNTVTYQCIDDPNDKMFLYEVRCAGCKGVLCTILEKDVMRCQKTGKTTPISILHNLRASAEGRYNRCRERGDDCHDWSVTMEVNSHTHPHAHIREVTFLVRPRTREGR